MSEIATLNTSILGLGGNIEKLINSLSSYESNIKSANKATEDITKLQKRLGIATRDGEKLFDKAGVRVNEYGQQITKVGEVMGGFNKRTAILNSTIAKFTKEGKAVPFLKGLNVYLKQGGNTLEYFAEFLSSSREELTVFGLEAAKARKVMYGFLPPGAFRLLNKFSSSFQFLGGTFRKIKDGGKGVREEIEKLEGIIASGEVEKGTEQFDKLNEMLDELRSESEPNFITSSLKGFKKIANFMKKPLVSRIEVDMKEARKILKKNSFSNIFFTKGQFKKRASHEFKQLKSPFKKAKKLFAKNFLLNLTPAKKQQIKQLKDAVKLAKKFDISKVSTVDVKKKQKDLGAAQGIKDDNVVALQTSFTNLGDEIIAADKKLRKIQKSIDGGNVGAWSKRNKAQIELNELLDKEEAIQRELIDAKTDYSNKLEAAISFADTQTAMVEENAQLIIDSEQKIDSIRTKGLQGYRKRLVDLKGAYEENREAFKKGFNNAEEIQKINDAIEKNKDKVAEVSNAYEDSKQILDSMIEMRNSGLFGIDDTAIEEAFQTMIKAEEEMNKALEVRETLQEGLNIQSIKSKGIKNLKDEIKLQKQTIKVAKERLAGAEKIINASNKQIKQSEKAKDKIIKDYEARIAAAESIPEQIRLSNEMDAELQKEDDKIDAATKDKNQAIKNQEAAVSEIDEGQVELEGSQEQLTVLQELKEEATKKLLEKFPALGFVFKIFKGLKAFPGAIMNILRAAGKYFLFVSLAIIGALIIIKKILPAIKDVWSNIIDTVAPLFEIVMAGASIFFEGFMKVFGAFFGDGSISEAIDGLIEMGLGLLIMAVGLALTGLSIALMLVWELTKVLWDKTVNYIYGMLTDGKKFLKRIGVVIAVIGVIVALIMGAPVWLAVVIGVVLWKATKPVIKMFKWLADKLNPSKWFGGGKAKGGITDGRMNLVGEEGPELVQLPKGSTVFSNSQSKKMVGGQTNNTVNNNHTHNYNIVVNAKDTSKAEMRKVANEIGKMLNTQILRNSRF